MLRTGFIAGWLLLCANSAYLAVSASPSLAYFLNVVVHPLLGLALTGIGAWWLLRQARRSSQIWLASAAVTAAAITGVLVLSRGALGANRWLLEWHILAGAAATVLVGVLRVRAAWD